MRKAQAKYHRWINVLPFMSAVLCALTFGYYRLGWLALVALVPMLLFMQHSTATGRKQLLMIWLSGLLFSTLNLLWLLDTKPESWAAINGLPAVAGSVFGWLLMAVSFSAGWWLFGWLALKLRAPSGRGAGWFLLLPAAWVVSEYARSWLFSVVIWGPDASLGPHWNFGVLGFAASATPLIYASRLLGLFGLSFVVVLINVGLLKLLQRQWKQTFIAAVVVAAITLLGYFGFALNNPKQVPIGLVQLKDYQSGYGPQLANLTSQAMQSQNRPMDALILPEYADFYDEDETDQKVIVESALKGGGGGVISSMPVSQEGRHYTAIQYRDQDGNILNEQHKNFLIPVGEYLPKAIEGLLKLTANDKQIEDYRNNRVHNRGQAREYPVRVVGTKFATLACSGVITPELYRQQADAGAEVLVNGASLDIFASNHLYFEQAQAMARFQAVANAKPFVQATRGGYNLVYDSHGKLLVKTQRRELNFIPVQITSSQTKTTYTKVGEWTVALATIVLIGYSIKKYKKL